MKGVTGPYGNSWDLQFIVVRYKRNKPEKPSIEKLFRTHQLSHDNVMVSASKLGARQLYEPPSTRVRISLKVLVYSFHSY